MSISDFLKKSIPVNAQEYSKLMRIIILLDSYTYMELLVEDCKITDILSQDSIMEQIVSIFVKQRIYLCANYSDYQKYLVALCISITPTIMTYMTAITKQYIEEKRIEELRYLSFILYTLSNFIKLAPLINLIDKYLYRIRIYNHQKNLTDKMRRDMCVLIRCEKQLHRYGFIDAVFQNSEKAITVQELASFCGYSLSTFKRLFKIHFHISPYKWMLKQRKEQVMYLIQFSNFLPFEIADRCNFSSASNFNSFCKKYLGDTPGNLISCFRQF